MSQYTQLNGIISARTELNDQYNSKMVFQFQPLQGQQNGDNVVFQIPQERIVVYQDSTMNLFPQIYKNGAPLAFNTDYELLSAIQSIIQFLPTADGGPPVQEDEISCTFNYVWFTDVEWDQFLNRAANKIGFSQYYVVGTQTVPGTSPLPAGGTTPNDIPDGLFAAICELGQSLAADALALRFSTRYDSTAGDQSYSPSQMAKSFTEIAKKLSKQAYQDRDDYYKGQGRQYRPAVLAQGYILPNWTPAR